MTIRWLDEAQQKEAQANLERCMRMIDRSQRPTLEEMSRRIFGSDEAESRGSLFELNTIGRFKDGDLRNLRLEEKPPRRSAQQATTIDLFLPNRRLFIECLALSGFVLKSFQAPLADSGDAFVEEYIMTAVNDTCYMGCVVSDQANKLYMGATRKAEEKELADLQTPVWLLIDAGDKLLENIGEPTDDAHLREVSRYFDEAATAESNHGTNNYLRISPNVFVSFRRWNRGIEEIVVLARTDGERDAAHDLQVHGLPLVIVRDGVVLRR